MKNYYTQNRGRLIERSLSYYHRNAEEISNKMTTDQRRKKNLRARYNITPEQYQELLNKQGHICAICKCEAGLLRVDHSKTTGEIRGLLCNECNLAIGLFNHDPEWTNAATIYLTDFEECREPKPPV